MHALLGSVQTDPHGREPSAGVCIGPSPSARWQNTMEQGKEKMVLDRLGTAPGLDRLKPETVQLTEPSN